MLTRDEFLLKVDGAAYSSEACKMLDRHDAEQRARIASLEAFVARNGYTDMDRKGNIRSCNGCKALFYDGEDTMEGEHKPDCIVAEIERRRKG